jgi:serine/threonine protein kinase
MPNPQLFSTIESGSHERAQSPICFGPYELIRTLGEGGMGVVYEARRMGLDKLVALKVLTCFQGHGATARFLQEARIAANLNHPHVVDCIDLGDHDGVPYLAMEFLEGETLRDRMNCGPMSVEALCDVMLPIFSAIAAAHDQQIIHRDIKPENIFLAQSLGETVPKMLDFGIAKVASTATSSGITQTSAIIGTPGYMAPEQAIDSKRVTSASDQFALGSVLWAAVAGEELYPGDSAIEVLFAVVHDAPRSLSALAPSAPPEFCAAVMKMLTRDPTSRFANVRDAARALLAHASPSVRTRWEREFGTALSVAVIPTPALSVTPRTAPPTRTAPTVDAKVVVSPRRSMTPIMVVAVIVVVALCVFVTRNVRPPSVSTSTPRQHTTHTPQEPVRTAQEPVAVVAPQPAPRVTAPDVPLIVPAVLAVPSVRTHTSRPSVSHRLRHRNL